MGRAAGMLSGDGPDRYTQDLLSNQLLLAAKGPDWMSACSEPPEPGHATRD